MVSLLNFFSKIKYLLCSLEIWNLTESRDIFLWHKGDHFQPCPSENSKVRLVHSDRSQMSVLSHCQTEQHGVAESERRCYLFTISPKETKKLRNNWMIS